MKSKNKSLSVLLIDDDYPTNYYNKLIIESNEFNTSVTIKETVKEATNYLMKLKQKRPHDLPELILIDINMPVQNGWEFLNTCKTFQLHDESRMVMIMLTTSSDPSDMNNAQNMGIVDDFFNKPLSKGQFSRIIAKFFPYLQINNIQS